MRLAAIGIRLPTGLSQTDADTAVNGGIVTSRQPWDVRHIHSQAAGFRKYLDKLRKELDARGDVGSGCIKNRFTCPVDRNSDVGSALRSERRERAVIVDLHGWVDERGPSLGFVRGRVYGSRT